MTTNKSKYDTLRNMFFITKINNERSKYNFIQLKNGYFLTKAHRGFDSIGFSETQMRSFVYVEAFFFCGYEIENLDEYKNQILLFNEFLIHRKSKTTLIEPKIDQNFREYDEEKYIQHLNSLIGPCFHSLVTNELDYVNRKLTNSSCTRFLIPSILELILHDKIKRELTN